MKEATQHSLFSSNSWQYVLPSRYGGVSMETIAEIQIGDARITVYRDEHGRIILGGYGWLERYQAEELEDGD
jgi:hypothetical protein